MAASHRRPSRAALRDPALGAALARVAPYPGFPVAGSADSHFHSLAHAIVSQQLATAAARTIHGRVRALTPGPRFPRPAELLALDPTVLRGAGLSAAKLAALTDLAQRCVDGRLALPRVSRLSDEAVIERLVEVRGIGRWTAQMFLLFRLGRLDVLAPDDLGLREGLRRLDGLVERPSPKELAARGERWAPLRSVASWVLWRLCEE